MSRAPRSRFYDGALYRYLLDPMLSGLHGLIAKQVAPGERVLDVGCGTGDLAFRMASTAREVVGIELSPAMVEYSNERLAREGRANVSFLLGDSVTAMADEPPHAFDTATMVLMLHELPTETREPVLREAARLAQRVVCVDFHIPMPKNIAGMRNRLAELLAGREHFLSYRDFARRGGVREIAASAGLAYERVRTVDAGTMEISEIRNR